MLVTQHPPRRSRRALLTHRAPALGFGVLVNGRTAIEGFSGSGKAMRAMEAGSIFAHEAAVADDIRSKNCGEAALHDVSPIMED